MSRHGSASTGVSSPGEETGAAQRLRHPSASPAARIRFAHPSERVFAVLLDLHGIRWEYEPVEFTLRWDEEGTPSGGFRPDFWLPDLGCFVELTTADQRLVTRKNAKVRRMRELYPEVEVVVLYQRDFLELLTRHGLNPSRAGAA
jgi:hypoxanthine phosphoribosyltransferase